MRRRRRRGEEEGGGGGRVGRRQWRWSRTDDSSESQPLMKNEAFERRWRSFGKRWISVNLFAALEQCGPDKPSDKETWHIESSGLLEISHSMNNQTRTKSLSQSPPLRLIKIGVIVGKVTIRCSYMVVAITLKRSLTKLFLTSASDTRQVNLLSERLKSSLPWARDSPESSFATSSSILPQVTIASFTSVELTSKVHRLDKNTLLSPRLACAVSYVFHILSRSQS
ncbi:LOW QUALITY PROTEIN: hypothetical protein V1478_003077 [Vespula squamosa]|uniref:Uncharacterized protein n=1 Tax=Vespula squamosa TaxID=30214 RepID=A0ABD2BRP2_VESSQ